MTADKVNQMLQTCWQKILQISVISYSTSLKNLSRLSKEYSVHWFISISRAQTRKLGVCSKLLKAHIFYLKSELVLHMVLSKSL